MSEYKCSIKSNCPPCCTNFNFRDEKNQSVSRIDDKFICNGYLNKNEDILSIHEDSKDPTVLVSPSLGLGIDLKGDLASQIIHVSLSSNPKSDQC